MEMDFEINHPIVPLTEWLRFRARSEPEVPSRIIDRYETGLPDNFVPLARGGIIPSDDLMNRVVGRHHEGCRPHGWKKSRTANGFQKYMNPKFLFVTSYGNQNFWTIERYSQSRDDLKSREVLVFDFGSTPVLTRSYALAMRLAVHCHVNQPLPECRWINTFPNDFSGAIELARRLLIDEAMSERRALPEMLLHWA